MPKGRLAPDVELRTVLRAAAVTCDGRGTCPKSVAK